ncbi:MAG: DUF2284 domain-containing protein [Candidatus Methanofastidiosia archaeon]
MIENIRKLATALGARSSSIIDPKDIKICEWTRMKCRFGCPSYGKNYTCPPFVPSLDEISKFFSEYSCALLVEFANLKTLDEQNKVLEAMLELEKQAFFYGYYKAFCIGAGPCKFCKKCKAITSKPCSDERKRPSLESLGVDVFELVNRSGFTLKPIHKKDEEFKSYGLLLIY